MSVSMLSDPATAAPLLAADLEYATLLRGPSLHEMHIAREQRRLEQALEHGFAVRSPAALALVRALPWDSAHFGVPCADLVRLYAAGEASAEEQEELLEAVLEEARGRGVSLLTARLRGDQLAAVQTLERLGFGLCDTSVEVGGLRPLPAGAQPEGVKLRAPRPADGPRLEELAASFTANRFHRDPRIDPERARQVYVRWVSEAAAGRRGSLLCAEVEGELAGFATYLEAEDALGVDIIGLLIVGARWRGVGLLGALVRGCAGRLRGCALVSSTQVGNTAALRGFARAGLLPFAARHVLHGWL